VLLFHAELDDDSHSEGGNSDPTLYSTFLESRPQQLEMDAISLITNLQLSYPNLRCHIVHLSAASALPIIRAAKAAGLKLSVETCFHYLCLSSDDIPSGHPEFKCCPPIRDTRNQDILWDALKAGVIDCVVSDHSPCIAELKHMDEGNIMTAWGGISTLGLGLSLLWTEANNRGVSIAQIVRWTSQNTAKHAGLDTSKGQLRVGYDADFIVWDPDAEHKVWLSHEPGRIVDDEVIKVTLSSLRFRNKVSPYVGKTLRGRVERTYLRGVMIYDRTADDTAEAPLVGKLI
jgi:allantoinase